MWDEVLRWICTEIIVIGDGGSLCTYQYSNDTSLLPSQWCQICVVRFVDRVQSQLLSLCLPTSYLNKTDCFLRYEIILTISYLNDTDYFKTQHLRLMSQLLIWHKPNVFFPHHRHRNLRSALWLLGRFLLANDKKQSKLLNDTSVYKECTLLLSPILWPNVCIMILITISSECHNACYNYNNQNKYTNGLP